MVYSYGGCSVQNEAISWQPIYQTNLDRDF